MPDGGYAQGPVTEHAVSLLEAEVFDQIDLGTHTIFIGSAVNTEAVRDGRPLTYQYYREFLKGKSPPNSPTYMPSRQADNSKEKLK